MVVVGRFEPVVELGLGRVLQRDFDLQVPAIGLDEDQFDNAVEKHAIDVAILPESVDRDRLTQLRKASSPPGLLILTHGPSHAGGMAWLAAGCSCVALSVSPSEVLWAIHLIASGGRLFIPFEGEHVERHWPAHAAQMLTPREMAVLRLISEGQMSYAQIALALGIRPETVRRHTVSIRRKLNLRRRGDLIGIPVPNT